MKGFIQQVTSRFVQPALPPELSAFELSDLEQLTLCEGDELERALRLLARRFRQLARHAVSLEQNLKQTRAAIDFYSSAEFAESPQSVFQRPAAPTDVRLSEPHKLERGEVVDVAFTSAYQPHYSGFSREYKKHRANQTVYARMWKHPRGESLGRIVALHGWFMGDQRVNAAVLVPGFFYRLGLDVVMLELPYHGRRAGAMQGGSDAEGFPSIHLARTNEAIAQTICDVRSIAAWLDSEEQLPMGVSGVSLGGYIASLWASLDELDFVIPIVPLVNMTEAALMLLGQSSLVQGRQRLAEEGVTTAELERVFEVHAPLSHVPKIPRGRRMIIAGKEDPIIPPRQAQELWRHWGEPNLFWLEKGHLAGVAGKGALCAMHQFLLSLGLAHDKPLSIAAEDPTVSL